MSENNVATRRELEIYLENCQLKQQNLILQSKLMELEHSKLAAEIETVNTALANLSKIEIEN